LRFLLIHTTSLKCYPTILQKIPSDAARISEIKDHQPGSKKGGNTVAPPPDDQHADQDGNKIEVEDNICCPSFRKRNGLCQRLCNRNPRRRRIDLWFPLVAVAAILWAKNRPGFSGLALGIAVGLQTFPLFFGLAIVVRGIVVTSV
jgi:hypothetical protein